MLGKLCQRGAVLSLGFLLCAGEGLAQESPPSAPPPPADAPAKPAPPAPPAQSPASSTSPAQPRVDAPRPPPRKAKPAAAPQAGKRRSKATLKRPTVISYSPDQPLVSTAGFYPLDNGGTRVAVEVSRRVEITESKRARQLSYRIRGAELVETAKHLPLVTGYIATPVDRVKLERTQGDVELVIDLRLDTEPVYRVVDTPRGIVLQVDFPRVLAASEEPDHTPPPPTEIRETRHLNHADHSHTFHK